MALLTLAGAGVAPGVDGVLSADSAFLRDGAGRFDVVIVPPSDGRPTRDSLGGCGKDAILTDFLTDLSPLEAAEALLSARFFSVGTTGVDAACVAAGDLGTGMAGFEGARSLEGVCGAEGIRGDMPEAFTRGFGRLLRVLGTGSGGSAAVGGS